MANVSLVARKVLSAIDPLLAGMAQGGVRWTRLVEAHAAASEAVSVIGQQALVGVTIVELSEFRAEYLQQP